MDAWRKERDAKCIMYILSSRNNREDKTQNRKNGQNRLRSDEIQICGNGKELGTANNVQRRREANV